MLVGIERCFAHTTKYLVVNGSLPTQKSIELNSIDIQPVAGDVLAPTSMKNVANCDK